MTIRELGNAVLDAPNLGTIIIWVLFGVCALVVLTAVIGAWAVAGWFPND